MLLIHFALLNTLRLKTIRDEDGIVTDFETTGDFPRYGNDDDRADEIAVWLLKTFLRKIKQCHTYRDSRPTTSILTITSNVVYGKATASLRTEEKPANRLHRCNPSYGAEKNGLLASLNSVAKLPYEYALTVFQIHRQLILTLWVMKSPSRLQIL